MSDVSLSNIHEESIPSLTRPRIDPIEALALLWKKRKFIAICVGCVIVVTVVISLLLPPYYKSTATILPETQSSKLASIGGLSDLAALAGVNVGGEGSLVKLYPTIVESESVLREVIYRLYKTKEFRDSVNLIQYWGIDETKPGRAYDAALKNLRDKLDVSMDLKTSVISLSIEMKEPMLSAEIVNNIVAALDKFILTKRTTSASEQRKFVEGRLAEVKEDLKRSEEDLKNFRERNAQVRAPQLLLDQGRLNRDVEINTTLFIELKKQYEIAKIEEVKNLPVINVLDSASPAVSKARPQRILLVIEWFVLGLFAAVAYVLGIHYFRESITAFLSELRSKIRQSS